MREVSARADEVMPNTSALIGGLVAARLLSRAGGLATLARMPGEHHPGSRLGAGALLASPGRVAAAEARDHLPAPPGPQRPPEGCAGGRVARVLAAKLAIAARLDYYRGEAVPEFLEGAQARIDEAGGSRHDPAREHAGLARRGRGGLRGGADARRLPGLGPYRSKLAALYTLGGGGWNSPPR